MNKHPALLKGEAVVKHAFWMVFHAFRSNACVLFLSKTFCVCFFQLCFLAYSQARMSACIESSYRSCNTNNQPFYRSSQVSGLLKFFGYASWISYFAILSTCEDKKENRFEMWTQKRKSVQELKRSAGLPIEADESVLMWEEWKGKRSEKHKCCIYSRFPNPTFSQLGNLRSRQRMTLRTNRAKNFTAHTSPLIICLYHLDGSPFPNIIWRPPTSLIWNVVNEALHFLTSSY